MAHHRRDILWKSIMEEFPISFVQFFYKDADTIFDFNTPFQFLDKELQQIAPDWQQMADAKTVDKLLKCGALKNPLSWLLLLVEIQGKKVIGFVERVYKYFSRLVDKYGNRVMVLVIYTDSNKSYQPSFVQYQMEGTSNRFDFKTYKVLDQNEQLLAADNNIFGLIVLTVFYAIKDGNKATDEQILASKIRLLKNLKNRDLPPEELAKVLTFIRLYTRFANPEMNLRFEKEIDTIIHKSRTMGIFEFAIQDAAEEAFATGKATGIEQGVERGHMERNTSFVRNLLSKQTFSLEEIAEVAEVSIDFVQSIKIKLC